LARQTLKAEYRPDARARAIPTPKMGPSGIVPHSLSERHKVGCSDCHFVAHTRRLHARHLP
jgi:hypothetical protein